MPFAGCTADVHHDPLRRRFRMYGFLSHLHSLMVTMSQKSSVPQTAKSVSQGLMSDIPGDKPSLELLLLACQLDPGIPSRKVLQSPAVGLVAQRGSATHGQEACGGQ